MEDWVLGLLAIAAGALFCFRGYLTMRVIIPIWGGFAGFVLGAGLVSGSGDDGFLRTGLGWVVGLAIGIAFALIAYLYYEVSVVIAMTAIGFTLGTSLMVALGVDWDWAVIAVGVVVGLLLAIVAVVINMPMAILTVLTATAGASAIVGGVMVLTGELESETIARVGETTAAIGGLWWNILWLVLAFFGMVIQLRAIAGLSRSMREAWEEGPSFS